MKMIMNHKDLFEEVSYCLNCTYISDLAVEPYKTFAKKIMSNYDVCECSLYELSDMAQYLYGVRVSFENIEDAEKYFKM